MAPMIPIIYFLFPESPTWLHNQQRIDDMEKSERKLAKLRRIKYEPSMSPICNTLIESPTFAVVHQPIPPSQHVCTLMIDDRLRRRTLVLWLLWFTASLSSYANDLNSSNLHGNLYLNQILFALMIALSKSLLYVLDRVVPRFSRRQLHQIPQSIVIVCFIVIVLLLVTKVKRVDVCDCTMFEYLDGQCKIDSHHQSTRYRMHRIYMGRVLSVGG